MGAVRWLTGDYPGAAAARQEALGIFRDLGDRRGEADALNRLGVVRWLTGNYPGRGRRLDRRRWASSGISATGATRPMPSTYWGSYAG